MQLLELLQNNMSAALIVFGLLGLCVGSFLNVVIHRMPLMMFYSWRQECSEFMSQQPDITPEQSAVLAQAVANDTPITLSRPASRCPHCAHKIKWYENIPLVSWLALRGRCSARPTAAPTTFTTLFFSIVERQRTDMLANTISKVARRGASASRANLSTVTVFDEAPVGLPTGGPGTCSS